MRVIFLALMILLNGCGISDSDKNYFIVRHVKSYKKGVCKYAIDLTNSDYITFTDSCGKFDPGDKIHFIK
jgi:hypothetical protein